MAASSDRSRPRLSLIGRLALLIALFCISALLAVWMLPQEVPPWVPSSGDGSIAHLSLSPTDRVLILSPHPDDDILACAGVIQHARALGLPLRVVYLTNGDANEWSFITYSHRLPLRRAAVEHMGDVRHDEAIAGEATLGVDAHDLSFLGYPDHGTLAIFTDHWNAARALRSIFTRVREVPYAYALSPHAPYKGEAILDDLQRTIERFRPTQIFVSSGIDLNVDHRALYLFARVALWHLPEVHAQMHPFLVHWHAWPSPEGLHGTLSMTPPQALRASLKWEAEGLDGDEIDRKEAALRCHHTQMSYSARYLLSFVRADELFGEAPQAELRVPPESVEVEETGDKNCVGDEPAALAGHEWRFARIRRGRLEFVLAFGKPVARETRATAYFCGDRPDRPFSAMPKLSVHVDPFHLAVYDQAKRLRSHDVRVDRVANRMTFSIPLGQLGNPRHLMVSVRTVLGEIPIDEGVWSVIEVTP